MAFSVLLHICIILVFIKWSQAHPHFKQPEESDCGEAVTLHNKCFIYSTLNALKEAKVTTILDSWDQTAADSFVTSLGSHTGGGPNDALAGLKALKPDSLALPSTFQVIEKTSITQSMSTTVKQALDTGNVAIAIGVTRTTDGANHWVYAKKAQSGVLGEIAGYDQQLDQDENFVWKETNSIERAKQTEDQQRFDREKLEKVADLKKDKSKRKADDYWGWSSYKDQNRPTIDAAKYAFIAKITYISKITHKEKIDNWKITKIALIGEYDNIKTLNLQFYGYSSHILDAIFSIGAIIIVLGIFTGFVIGFIIADTNSKYNFVSFT